jgi:hypothetical protein
LRGVDVRAKALTYLRSENNDADRSRDEDRSRFPEGMTERKARAKAREEADSQRE